MLTIPRSLFLLLSLLGLLALAGCGGGGSNSSVPEMDELGDAEFLLAEPASEGGGLEELLGLTELVRADITLGELNSAVNTADVHAASTSTTSVAVLSIFADATATGAASSGDGHAWISVRCASTNAIAVGNLTGIRKNRTVTLGTFGNKSEHVGLWYNLEAYFISKYGKSAYPSRVSYSYILTQSELDNLNTYIGKNDRWSLASNCTSFAVRAWNEVVSRSYRLSNGTLNTPSALAKSIKSTFRSYSSGAAVPFDYVVCYANGKKKPVKSTTYR